MKYNEEELLTELRDYIIGTYNQHYATDKIQTLDPVSYTHLTLPTTPYV